MAGFAVLPAPAGEVFAGEAADGAQDGSAGELLRVDAGRRDQHKVAVHHVGEVADTFRAGAILANHEQVAENARAGDVDGLEAVGRLRQRLEVETPGAGEGEADWRGVNQSRLRS